jgi:hypothetical protein
MYWLRMKGVKIGIVIKKLQTISVTFEGHS